MTALYNVYWCMCWVLLLQCPHQTHFLLFSLNPPSLLSSLSCSLLSPNLWLPFPVFHHSLHTSPNQPEKQKLVVVSMSPHSRASIASKYNLPASEVGTYMYISSFIVLWVMYRGIILKQVYRCSGWVIVPKSAVKHKLEHQQHAEYM